MLLAKTYVQIKTKQIKQRILHINARNSTHIPQMHRFLATINKIECKLFSFSLVVETIPSES